MTARRDGRGHPGDGWLRQALEAAGLGSFVWHPADDRAEVDARLLALYDLPPGSPLNFATILSDHAHPADRDALAAATAAALDPAGSGEVRVEYRVVRPDGSVRWLAVTGRTEFAGAPPRPVRMFGTVADVTDRKAAVEWQAFLLRLSDALRPLADPTEVQATACRVLGERLAASRVFYCEVTDDAYLVGGQFATDLPPMPPGRYPTASYGDPVIGDYRAGRTVVRADAQDDPRLPPAVRAAWAGVKCRGVVGVPLLKDGRLVAVLGIHLAVRRDWSPVEVRLIEETAERTWAAAGRARAEAALRAGEERLRAVAANLPHAAVFVVGHDLRYQLAAGQALAAAGFAPADFEGKTPAEALPSDQAGVREATFRQTLAGESFRAEHPIAGRHYVTHGAPLRGADGAVTAALAVSYDITDRVTAEQSLQQGEERYRQLVESVRDHAIIGLDPAGVVASWNEGAERVFGFPAAEIVGRPADLLFTPEDRAAGLPEKELAAAAAAGRASDENWAVRQDGSRFWASGSSSAVRDAAGGLTGFVKVVRDRTETRAAAEAVRESRGRLRLALAAARMGIWRWDIADDVHSRDANLNRLLGRPAVDSRGPLADFLAAAHPDDREAVRTAFDQSVHHGHTLSTEFRVVWPDGTVHWLRDQGDVFGGADGQYLTGACVDVTEVKAAEAIVRQAHDELEERVRTRTAELADEVAQRERAEAGRREMAARLETAQEQERTRIARELHDSLGQYLAGMAIGLGAARRQAVVPAVRQELDRLMALTDEIGRESHRLALELRPTALDDVGLRAAVQGLVEAWSARTGVPADFSSRGLDGERPGAAYSTAVYRAVQESLTNVTKHARATRVSVLLDRKPDALVAIIEDDGRGFDPDAPANGGRRGLGLLGMNERIALAGGTLFVESAPGSGTTVYVRIPIPVTDPP